MIGKIKIWAGNYDKCLLVPFLFYLILSLIKISKFSAVGRFWAEEGAVFYPSIFTSKVFDGLFFVFNGHIEFVTNSLVLISTLFDLKNAPLVTTYLSLLVQSLPVIVLLKFRQQFKLNNLRIYLILVVMVGLPQSAEVFANTINLHFHFSILAALILAVSVHGFGSKLILRLMLLLSGASGVPANFLLPLFAFEAFRTKEKERIIQFLIILATTTFQLIMLAHNGVDGSKRNFFSDFSVIVLAPLAQTLISPLFGFSVADKLSIVINDARLLDLGSVFFVFVCCIPLVWFLIRIIEKNSRAINILSVSAIFLVFMNIFASLGGKSALISAASGGRYFYATNVLLFISFCSCLGFEKALTKLFVIMIFATSFSNIRHNFAGPNWEAAMLEWNGNSETGLKIWPAGWEMKLKK
jgi:hypothetical protein